VLAKNFGVSAESFSHTRKPGELYIFKADKPGNLEQDRIDGYPQIPSDESFSHWLLAQEPIRTRSGTVRITDSSVFKASKTITAALVEVEPGGLRELHWHANTNGRQ
jgi:oxalate decarboxylase